MWYQIKRAYFCSGLTTFLDKVSKSQLHCVPQEIIACNAYHNYNAVKKCLKISLLFLMYCYKYKSLDPNKNGVGPLVIQNLQILPAEYNSN